MPNIFIPSELVLVLVGQRPKRVGLSLYPAPLCKFLFFGIDLLDGSLNYIKMFEHPLSIRPKCDSGRMFLQIKGGRTKSEECFYKTEPVHGVLREMS